MLSNVLNQVSDKELELDRVDGEVVSNIFSMRKDTYDTMGNESDRNVKVNSHNTATFVVECNNAKCAQVISRNQARSVLRLKT